MPEDTTPENSPAAPRKKMGNGMFTKLIKQEQDAAQQPHTPEPPSDAPPPITPPPAEEGGYKRLKDTHECSPSCEHTPSLPELTPESSRKATYWVAGIAAAVAAGGYMLHRYGKKQREEARAQHSWADAVKTPSTAEEAHTR